MNVRARKTTHFVQEVELTGLLRLPSKPRHDHGLRMTCDGCGKRIDDEHFLAGFADGHPNMLLHESCGPDDDKRRFLPEEKP